MIGENIMQVTLGEFGFRLLNSEIGNDHYPCSYHISYDELVFVSLTRR